MTTRRFRPSTTELVLLGAEHRFHADQMRELPRPSARDGAAVEVDEQLEISGVREHSRYCRMRSCLSLCQKSTLTPFTPHFWSWANSLLRASRVVHAIARRLGDIVVWPAGVVPEQQADIPGFRVRNHVFNLPVCIRFQLASTSAYSHPISAARFVNALSASACFGLSLSDHQLQAARPGLTQLRVRRWLGRCRSFTRSDSRIRLAASPTITTRHGSIHGGVDAGSTAPTPSPSFGSGNFMR